jgi:hypothetical protein
MLRYWRFKKHWLFLEISQISPQSQKLKIPKLVQILAKIKAIVKTLKKNFQKTYITEKLTKKKI